MLHAFEGSRKKRKKEEAKEDVKSIEDRVNACIDASEWDDKDEIRRKLTICLENGDKYLDLSWGWIEYPNIANSLVPFLNDNPQIKGISLKHCVLEDAGIIYLVQNCRLEEIDCSENNITGAAIIEICKSETIHDLDISATCILGDDENKVEACRALSANNNLKTLNMSCVDGNGSIDSESANLLFRSRSITNLNLRNNSITSKGLKALRDNHVLLDLNIAWNFGINDRCVKYLLASSINRLDICATDISKEGILRLNSKEGLVIESDESTAINESVREEVISHKRKRI